MSAEANKALVRRFYQEIDKGNLAAMDELVAEDYIDHSPPPFPGLASGRAGLKQAFEIFWAATPGQRSASLLAMSATVDVEKARRSASSAAVSRNSLTTLLRFASRGDG